VKITVHEAPYDVHELICMVTMLFWTIKRFSWSVLSVIQFSFLFANLQEHQLIEENQRLKQRVRLWDLLLIFNSFLLLPLTLSSYIFRQLMSLSKGQGHLLEQGQSSDSMVNNISSNSANPRQDYDNYSSFLTLG
jgi:hypothetical protein